MEKTQKSEDFSGNKYEWNAYDNLEEVCCSICLEPWTSQGDHQVCCLPCGHVYGFSCIKRWHKFNGMFTSKCPQCCFPFRSMEVRKLYMSPTVLPCQELLKRINSLEAEIESLKLEKRKRKELQARLVAERRAHKTIFQELNRKRKKSYDNSIIFQSRLRDVTKKRDEFYKRLSSMNLLMVALSEQLNMVPESNVTTEQQIAVMERIRQIESRACLAEDRVLQLEAQLVEQQACIAATKAHILFGCRYNEGENFSGKYVSVCDVLRLLSSIKKGDSSGIKRMNFMECNFYGMCQEEATLNSTKRAKES